MKYVVIVESDTGYMQCVKVCDNNAEAHGEAYLQLGDIECGDSCYITLPEPREGENGYIIELRRKENDEVVYYATVLFYHDEKEDKQESNNE